MIEGIGQGNNGLLAVQQAWIDELDLFLVQTALFVQPVLTPSKFAMRWYRLDSIGAPGVVADRCCGKLSVKCPICM